MASSIYILSQPIQTGKTSLLMKWIQQQASVGGFLTPDVEGKRKLYDIQQDTYHNLQLQDDAEGIQIGRFRFDAGVFTMAQKIMQDAIKHQPDWIVIDEIGRLELGRNEGLEPGISKLITHFKSYTTSTKLLLVIRDYLLEDAKKQYGIADATLLSKDFFLTAESAKKSRREPLKDLTGIVLCGGQSVRMGRDKAFVQYHTKEQYAHVADRMKVFCKDVFISCNSHQKTKIQQHYQSILDNATFLNAGPMTGVLSAFQQLSNTSLLVMGCDYPHFTEADMTALIDAREDGTDVVCYHNPETGFDEPLLAIYEKQCAPLLFDFYQKGNTSLQRFLKTVNTKRIIPHSTNAIKSVDFKVQ
ncbi:MAG: NTP transferase domain-containing protein [Bacteroidota bacterium]